MLSYINPKFRISILINEQKDLMNHYFESIINGYIPLNVIQSKFFKNIDVS